MDDNAKWAAYNSTCAEMRWLCDNDGYGMLVRKWCPRTCGLCRPSPQVAVDASDTDDAVVLIAGRPALASSLELSMEKKKAENSTRKHMMSRAGREDTGADLMRSEASNFTSLADLPFSNATKNSTFAKANRTDKLEPSITKTEALQNMAPTQWEITLAHEVRFNQWEVTLPIKDALVNVLSKATLIPRALWSSDQEHFVFEVNSGSQNASDNVSTEASERPKESTSVALQEDEQNRCPIGYSQVVGHVYGGDQFGRGYNLFATSIRECARWCTHTPGCGSFDYSPNQKRCFRNSQTRPTSLLDREGYVFCRRSPCPSFLTEAACLGPAVSPGWLTEEVRLRPGSYCIWSAGKCQAPLACTFEDCFLPDGGLPGMDLPPSKTLWITRSGLMSTMAKVKAGIWTMDSVF